MQNSFHFFVFIITISLNVNLTVLAVESEKKNTVLTPIVETVEEDSLCIKELTSIENKLCKNKKFQDAINIWEEIASIHLSHKNFNKYVETWVERAITASYDNNLESMFNKYIDEGLYWANYYPNVHDSIKVKLRILKLYYFNRKEINSKKQTNILSEIIDWAKSTKQLLKHSKYYNTTAGYNDLLHIERLEGQLYWEYSELNKAKQVLTQSLNLYQDDNRFKTKDIFLEKIKTYHILASVHNLLGEFSQGLQALQQAKFYHNKINLNDSLLLDEFNYTSGELHLQTGNYKLALIFFKKTIKSFNKNKNKIHYNYMHYSVMNICDIYLHQQKYQSVIEEILPYLNKGSRKNVFEKTDPNSFINFLLKLIKTYILINNFEDTTSYLQQVTRLCNKFQHRQCTAYYLWATLKYQKKEYNKSWDYLEKVFHYMRNNKEVYYPERQRIYQLAGDVLIAQQQFQEGLVYYQKALTMLSIDFMDTTNLWQNPDVTKVSDKVNFLRLLQKKATAFFKQYPDEPKPLKVALQTIQQACEVIDVLRQGYAFEETKQLLAQQSMPIYEEGIAIALRLYKHTGNTSYQEQAFQFAERGKAAILLGIIQQAKWNKLEVDTVLIKEEERIQRELWSYKKKIISFGRTKKKKYNDRIAIWESKKMELEREWADVKEKLKKNKKQYSLKYDTVYKTVVDVQKKLLHLDQTTHQKHALVEYFMGNKKNYVFVIKAQDYKIVPIDNIETHNILLSHLKDEKLYDKLGKKLEKTFSRYATVAHKSYQELVAPIQSILQDVDHLIIIPDDRLHHIPFEILLSKPVKKDQLLAVADYSYLLNKYVISYSYSGTLWLEQMSSHKTTQPGKGMIAFAPRFGKVEESVALVTNPTTARARSVDDLKYNITEVKNIQKVFKGTLYLYKQATKQYFLKIVSQYSMIHLSTHAIVDDEQPMMSAIQLSDNLLYTHEIFNIDLRQSKLTVLSACETGTGVLAKGEGVISLSRAFTVAGCPSLVHSLWKANDQATAEIMVSFYTYLKKGYNKPAALRQAKLDYLHNSDKHPQAKHPAFWGTFIHSGNISPLPPESSFSLWREVGIGFGLLVLLIAIYVVQQFVIVIHK